MAYDIRADLNQPWSPTSLRKSGVAAALLARRSPTGRFNRQPILPCKTLFAGSRIGQPMRSVSRNFYISGLGKVASPRKYRRFMLLR